MISNYLKQVQKTPKVNFASLGNVVPQLHIHVIGRHDKDACWPAPVWGNLREVLEYEPEEVESIQAEINPRLRFEAIEALNYFQIQLSSVRFPLMVR